MCFSAPVSFVTSGFLTAAAVYSIKEVILGKNRSFLAIAIIPLLFAIQQLIEGWIWVLLESRESYSYLTTLAHLYVLFAYSLWPFFIPFSLVWFDRSRRFLFLILSITGFVYGAVTYIYLLMHPSFVQARIVDNSICYLGACGMSLNLGVLGYLFLTVGALLLASWNQLKMLGVLALLSAVLSYSLYNLTFASTWCFFAAILSLYVAYMAYRVNNP